MSGLRVLEFGLWVIQALQDYRIYGDAAFLAVLLTITSIFIATSIISELLLLLMLFVL